MICRSGGSKSRLAKAAGAEPSGQMRDEKLHAVMARSTFGSEKAHLVKSEKNVRVLSFVAVSATTTTTLHYTPLQLQQQLLLQPHYTNYITLHYTALHSTTLTKTTTTTTTTLHNTTLH